MARPSTTARGVDSKVPALGYINVTLTTKTGVKKISDFGIALMPNNKVAVRLAEILGNASPEAVQKFLAQACVFTYRENDADSDVDGEDLLDDLV